MWKLFWIETSRQFHAEELVQLCNDLSEEDLKYELEDWCTRVFPMWGMTDSHISYGYENLENIIGDTYPANPQGVRDWIEFRLRMNSTYEMWQERPYTAVRVITEFEDGEYQSFGFSKVKYPDDWDANGGWDIAFSKAIAKISKNILKNKLYDVLEFYRETTMEKADAS